MGSFEELIAGDFFPSILSSFTNVLVTNEIFYLLIWSTMIGVIMMRSRSWELGILIAIATSFAIMPLLSATTEKFVALFVMLGVSFMIYTLLKSK